MTSFGASAEQPSFLSSTAIDAQKVKSCDRFVNHLFQTFFVEVNKPKLFSLLLAFFQQLWVFQKVLGF